MDVRSLYTNVPQEEGIETVCKAYDAFYQEETPSPQNISKERKNSSFKKPHSSLTEKTTSKHMEQPWVLRWQSLLPTFLWGL